MKIEFVGVFTAVKFNGVTSGSVACTLKVKLEPSATVLEPMEPKTGARLTLVTVIATTSVSIKLPSDTLKVTLYTPAWVKLGLKVNEPAPLPLSKKVALVGTLTAVKVNGVKSGSVA